jgi:hypothetical protein
MDSHKPIWYKHKAIEQEEILKKVEMLMEQLGLDLKDKELKNIDGEFIAIDPVSKKIVADTQFPLLQKDQEGVAGTHGIHNIIELIKQKKSPPYKSDEKSDEFMFGSFAALRMWLIQAQIDNMVRYLKGAGIQCVTYSPDEGKLGGLNTEDDKNNQGGGRKSRRKTKRKSRRKSKRTKRRRKSRRKRKTKKRY